MTAILQNNFLNNQKSDGVPPMISGEQGARIMPTRPRKNVRFGRISQFLSPEKIRDAHLLPTFKTLSGPAPIVSCPSGPPTFSLHWLLAAVRASWRANASSTTDWRLTPFIAVTETPSSLASCFVDRFVILAVSKDAWTWFVNASASQHALLEHFQQKSRGSKKRENATSTKNI